jgi:hypothetical protein
MSRPSFFEPMAHELQPLVHRRRHTAPTPLPASILAAGAMVAAGEGVSAADPSAAVAAAAKTPGRIHITKLLVQQGAALDVAQIQRDVRAASRGRAWSLVLTPAHINARLSDADVRDVLMRQLPVYQSYDKLVSSIEALRVIDSCMQRPDDTDLMVDTAAAFGITREYLAERIRALLQIEAQPTLPDGYKRVRRTLNRREERLVAIDRIVDAYHQIIADGDALRSAASIASSLAPMAGLPMPIAVTA